MHVPNAPRTALDEAEERFRILSELSSDFVYMFEVRPNGSLKNSWLAEAFERVFGSSIEEMAQQSWRHWVVPDDHALARRRLRDLLRGRSFEGVVRVRDRAGRLRHIRDRARPVLDSTGRVRRVYGAATDITEAKRAQKQRRTLEARNHRAQKLESLGSLAAGIAHDFNNILVGVLGHADLALELLEPSTSAASPAGEEVRGHIDEIGRAAQHAADLVQQLLDFAGEPRLQSKALDLAAQVRDMRELLNVSVGKGLRVRYELPDSLPSIEADSTQIKQILMNLVMNAADACADGKGTEINVEAGTRTDAGAEIGSANYEAYFLDDPADGEAPSETDNPCSSGDSRSGGHVFLSVSDDGAGMDEATRERLFEPFYTTKTAGRGLGMATVLGIVRSHRGAVSVESEPGEGTTIRVLFPCRAGGPGARERSG